VPVAQRRSASLGASLDPLTGDADHGNPERGVLLSVATVGTDWSPQAAARHHHFG